MTRQKIMLFKPILFGFFTIFVWVGIWTLTDEFFGWLNTKYGIPMPVMYSLLIVAGCVGGYLVMEWR